MGDRRIRSGWCIEHEAPEVFSFGDTPRWFCIQNDDEDYCIIVPLFTRQEFIDSLDMEAAASEFRVATYDHKKVARPFSDLAPGAKRTWIQHTEPIIAAALGKEQT